MKKRASEKDLDLEKALKERERDESAERVLA
jgi:hypothetical protein